MNSEHLQWWSNLRHGGMLLDAQRLSQLIPALPEPLDDFQHDRLRRELLAFQDAPGERRGPLVAFVLEKLCGFTSPDGQWHRGGNVPATWTRRGLTGEAIRPGHLWLGPRGAVLPVFIDAEKRVGIGRGRRIGSQVLQWLRQGDEQLAVITNGRQWRLVFAGLDFAESREGLLPTDNAIFQSAYSLQGLRDQLDRTGPHKLKTGFSAYPRILALARLIHRGSSHEAMLVPAYNGDLFAPGEPDSPDGMRRALHLLEAACLGADVMSDHQVRQILDLLTRTRVRLRQGRASMWVTAPVDFSNLDSEYIGILYEGLLDFELRCAAEDEPIVFLAVGDEPALPLATLEAMDDKAIRNLLEKLKDTSAGDDEEAATDGEEGDAAATDDGEPDEEAPESEVEVGDEAIAEELAADDDPRYTLQARAEQWAHRACEVGGLVRKPRGGLTPEKRMQHEQAVARRARQLVLKVVLPGEWYLVRWGGTRKGSGTFYTRPQLAIPTVHRTLRPLAYDPPTTKDGQPNLDAPTEKWTPKKPEDILRLKVCDPACGSGSFPLAALRFLTTALYESLTVHDRIHDHAGRAVLALIYDDTGREALVNETLPCRPEDEQFEPRTKAILRRYIVERCIYGVDVDPLAVELCRLSLWIETLDRNLPMTFLQHKIRCGNSLVGAWFDQFLHYPTMAFEREGGDKTHTNGVHHAKEAWTKAIREFQKQVKEDLIRFIDGSNLFYPVDLTTVRTGHDEAEAALNAIHALGITQVNERAERYEALQRSPAFQHLKDAFNLWCALWFWPADQLEHAPLPTQFASNDLADAARAIAHDVATDRRFFHWELEFPDVFNATTHGFDAVFGNPPWDIAKPNSKEFFSAYDPLYRGYGKQEAVQKQAELFSRAPAIERQWLDYNASFKAMSHWTKHAGFPFGDRVTTNSQGKKQHDLNLGDRGRRSFESSQARHDRWRQKREETSGYADADHAFRHQGSADINLYKLFLEQAHALLSPSGRMGLIVPSGLYSDHGTGDLRRLFVDQCRWEWLFGFENREGIFDIHRSFKFNPVIIAKGGQTEVIRTAFMRRSLADWERAERHATEYPREQIVQFSPRSRAILEIQSQRDLEVLTKIYSNSVLLGDDGPDGWGIKYATEFHMTNDSKLFPPRPKWEEWGYRPDEYSRWIKGPWQPIDQLWQQLGVDPANPTPIDPDCAQRIEQGIASGEVARTDFRGRCAQPPYDRLPIPRADIPAGIILSRDGDAFIHENDIPEVTFTDANGKPLKIKVQDEDGKRKEITVTGPAVALSVYNAKMFNLFNFSSQGWVSGKGRGAKWQDVGTPKHLSPEYLMGYAIFERLGIGFDYVRLLFKDISTAIHFRTTLATITPWLPAVNAAPVLRASHSTAYLRLQAMVGSLCLDFVARRRIGYLHLNQFVINELPLVRTDDATAYLYQAAEFCARLCMDHAIFAPAWCRSNSQFEAAAWRASWAAARHEHVRFRAALDAVVASAYGIDESTLLACLELCDLPQSALSKERVEQAMPVKGFWRVDKDKHPEHRHTVLSLIAFHDLQEKIDAHGGDVGKGIEVFCNQNDGEGWMLPETLRLADYALGHDERANHPQPVRECFGPRFHDWQLAQTPEESWRECHLHARNLLGEAGYRQLLVEIESGGHDETGELTSVPADTASSVEDKSLRKRSQRPRADGTLFDI